MKQNTLVVVHDIFNLLCLSIILYRLYQFISFNYLLDYSKPFIITQNNLNLTTTPRQYFGPVDIQNIQIQLLDEYGRVINLNNMDYSFCLTFQTIYDL